MSLLTQDSVALATILFVFLAIARRASHHKKRWPPGPTPIPFLGNIFNINAAAPWVSYAEMRETYGAFSHSSFVAPVS